MQKNTKQQLILQITTIIPLPGALTISLRKQAYSNILKILQPTRNVSTVHVMGYLTIKLQNSTWYKCLNLSLTGSCMYLCTHIHTEGHTFIGMYTHTHVRKTEKLYAPGIIRYGGIKMENFPIKNSDFSYFCSKHRLWVLDRTASVRLF